MTGSSHFRSPCAAKAAAGADAVGVFEQKVKSPLDDAKAHCGLSSHLDHDDA